MLCARRDDYGLTYFAVALGLALAISAGLYIACKSLVPVGTFPVLAAVIAGVHFGQEVAHARVVETAQSPECAGRIEQVEEALGAHLSDLDASELCKRCFRNNR